MRSLYLATILVARVQSFATASKKPAVQALLESAATMLKNGATPDVTEFAAETLASVSETVIPAIIAESNSDQSFINSLHDRFITVQLALADGNIAIDKLNSEQQGLSTAHKSCRGVEATKCISKRDCETQLHGLWYEWVECENTLEEIHGHIDGHFCPDPDPKDPRPVPNGTLHTFRVASVPKLQQYMTQKLICDQKELAYDDYVDSCKTTHAQLESSSNTCNVVQTDLEDKACQHTIKIQEVVTQFDKDWEQASSAYHCAMEEVMQLEKDRKREYVTLQVVNCLLLRIQEQNGVPCDDANGGVTEEVAICEERHTMAVCDPADGGDEAICLEYKPVPDKPHVPPGVPMPCDPLWRDQEYANLPLKDWPSPPFSETNPGCNAYPACSACVLPEPQSSLLTDSCPGYTVAGCQSDAALTFVRDVNEVADVMCCSIDGNECKSDGFVGATNPTGCYFQLTHQEALKVCHDSGMRMCTKDELETCCEHLICHDTNSVVWVDNADSTVPTPAPPLED